MCMTPVRPEMLAQIIICSNCKFMGHVSLSIEQNGRLYTCTCNTCACNRCS